MAQSDDTVSEDLLDGVDPENAPKATTVAFTSGDRDDWEMQRRFAACKRVLLDKTGPFTKGMSWAEVVRQTLWNFPKLKTENDRLVKANGEMDETITMLTEEIENVKERNRELEHTMNQYSEKMEDIQEQVDESNTELIEKIQMLSQQLDQYRAIIGTLEENYPDIYHQLMDAVADSMAQAQQDGHHQAIQQQEDEEPGVEDIAEMDMRDIIG